MKKEKKKKKWWIGIIVLVCIFAMASAGNADTENNNEQPTVEQTQENKVAQATAKPTKEPEVAKPEFTMRSNDTIGAAKHTVVGADYSEPSGTYEVVCVKGHGALIVNDADLYVFAQDEYKGTEYSGLIYEEKMVIELNGNDELLARAYNSSEFKLEFYLVD